MSLSQRIRRKAVEATVGWTVEKLLTAAASFVVAVIGPFLLRYVPWIGDALKAGITIPVWVALAALLVAVVAAVLLMRWRPLRPPNKAEETVEAIVWRVAKEMQASHREVTIGMLIDAVEAIEFRYIRDVSIIPALAEMRRQGRLTWNSKEMTVGREYVLKLNPAWVGADYTECSPGDARSKSSGPVEWDLSGIFTMGTYRGDNTLRFSGFMIHGRNTTDRPITQMSGYIRSNITNETLQIYVTADGKRVLPEQTLGIPPGARIEVSALFGPDAFDDVAQMLDEPTLLQRFGDSTFVVELDGRREEHRFSRDDIERIITKGKRSLYGVAEPRIKEKGK
jgi:hypothetical protein